MDFSAKELATALNDRLAGTMKVVDMTPVVEANRATVESLKAAVQGKPDRGVVV